MARPRKTLPARARRDALDDSLLIRSAESLGRMIGALQREIDAARQLAGVGAGSRKNGAPAGKRSAAATAKRTKKAQVASATRATTSKADKSARPQPAKRGKTRTGRVT